MKAIDRILIALSACALAINGLLFYWKISSAGIAGCGGGGACDGVLDSRWSQVLGLPVPLAGVAVYAMLIAALWWGRRSFASAGFVAVGGAAIWFVVVQALILKRFCPWCMAAHALGAGIAVVGLAAYRGTPGFRGGWLAGGAAVYALALAQVFGPVPATHRIDDRHGLVDDSPEGIHARGMGPKVAFDGGRKVFDAGALPRLGPAAASRVMVEYFDYRCPACRTMSHYLDALVRRHPNEIAILLLPVPLEKSCNPVMAEGDAEHPGSCELARLALAVWRGAPEAFPEVHRSFLADPPMSVEAARKLASQALAGADVEAALRDPWIDAVLQADVDDWAALSGGGRQLPKLLIRERRILHGLPSGEADFIRVMEAELGL